MTDTTVRLTISAASPTAFEAYGVLRAYMAEVASRYWGRPATAEDVDEVLLEDPSDDLVPPSGVFLLARDASGPWGAWVSAALTTATTNSSGCTSIRPHAGVASGGI